MKLLGLVGIVQLPGLTQRAPDRSMQRFRQSLHDVASLVDLTALDRARRAEGAPDRLGQRLGAVDDEQPRHRRIEPALDQIVDQRLDHRGVLGRTLDQAERMLDALHRRPRSPRPGSDLRPCGCRRSAPPGGRARTGPTPSTPSCAPPTAPRSGARPPISTRQPLQAPERRPRAAAPPGGNLRVDDVDQHQVHRPLAEPVLRNRRLPARHSQLLPVEAAHPRPLDLDLAAVEADLALRLPPAVRPPRLAPRMAWPTDRLRIVLHHRAKRLHAGSQAEPLEARRNFERASSLERSRRNRSRHRAMSLHGVAFLCGISTPSLSAQGEQRRSSYFNIHRDIPALRFASAVAKGTPVDFIGDEQVARNAREAPSLHRHLKRQNAKNTGSCTIVKSAQ